MSSTEPLSIICPFCGEPAGKPCRSRSMKPGAKRLPLKKPHLRRVLKACGLGL